MNLMKLFNLKYFKENIKKSKGLVAFVLGLVPLLNIVLLSVWIADNGNLLTFNVLSIITQIGLYFVPIILAFVLFGFVFKRQSVDFVMSNPISRKSLYFTNIIGGFILLFLFMLFNGLIFAVFNILFSSIIIPFALLVDYFVFYLISYLFMFSVAVLAITLAGNLMGSIVLILIIIFLYPFLIISNLWFSSSDSNNYIKCTTKTCAPTNYLCTSDACKDRFLNNEYYLSYTKDFNAILTAPMLILKIDDTSMYDIPSLIKMCILSSIYLVLGYYQFKRRKMENNEISFKSEFVHFFVKSITLIPVTFIAMLIIQGGEFIGLIVSLVLVFIYYIVYDLITRKEIYKFIKSIGICYTTFLIILGLYYIIPHFINKEMLIEDVSSISVDYIGVNYTEKLIIKNKNVINTLIRETLSSSNQIDYSRKLVTLTSKNKKYLVNLILTPETESLIEKCYMDYQKEKKLNYNYQSIDYVSDMPVTKKLKNLIQDAMTAEPYQSETNLLDYLKVYDYRNHDYEVILVPYMQNDKLFKYIQDYENKELLKILEKENNNIDFYLVSDNAFFTEFDHYVFNYVLQKNLKDFTEFVSVNNNSKDNDSLIIQVLDGYSHVFHIYNGEAFKKEFKRYQEKLKNDETYLIFIKDFKDMQDEY